LNCSEVNELLDRLMDNDLDEDMRAALEMHAQSCPQCAENIRATIEMKEMLDGMDDEAEVPLAAQAAWRKAVKQEAVRMHMRKTHRAFGAVAAAVVVFIGVGFAVSFGNVDTKIPTDDALKTEVNFDETAAKGIAVIESDGAEASVARAVPEMAKVRALTEFIYTVESIDSACGYISDLVAEYEGSVDEQRVEDNKANLYISLPAENVEDFLTASSYLDVSGQLYESTDLGSVGNVSILIVLKN